MHNIYVVSESLDSSVRISNSDGLDFLIRHIYIIYTKNTMLVHIEKLSLLGKEK